MKQCTKGWMWLWILLGLNACSSFPLPPVSEQSRLLRSPESEYRFVQAGDTLYSIAWESGRDYRDVAKWNRIPPPYLIHPGDKIRLYPPAGSETSSRPPAPASEKKVTTRRATSPEKTNPPIASRKSAGGNAKALSWVRPARGDVLLGFSSSGPNKGIDIAGTQGQPIYAAEAGQVVYQGGGLRGYGQLIIVKHNEDFLSAYAHCDKIFVKEGIVVKRGQKIAEMGSSGTNRIKLHFEIRYRGTPVDPQDYLPRK